MRALKHAAALLAAGAGLALFLASLLTSYAARADEPLVIRHGWVSMTNALSPMIFENKAILRHYGKTYIVEPVHFTGTSTQIQAIAANQIDIITLGFSTLAAGVQNAGLDLRVVADSFQDGVPGHLSSPFMVLNDSGIKRIEDLKGKVLATNAIGGSLDVALLALLRKHGMEDKRDVTIIEAAFPNMNAMLLERKVDMVSLTPPFIYDPALEQNAHVLARMKDGVGQSQMIVLAARKDFLEKNRAALYDFFEDMLVGVRWFLDPANRQDAIAIVAGLTKQPVERLQYLYTKDDFYHSPDARPNLAAMQNDMETQVKLGFLKQGLDVKQYVDLSFIDEAARRLKQ
jgi:sulfonate transport system substrate-binding protein